MAVKELTEGKPLKLILLFMLPIFIGNMFQQLYLFVDSVIVGRAIGIEALAAVGTTMPLIFLIISFVFASTQGFAVVTAQKFGARDYAAVKKSVGASFLLSGILTLVVTLVSAPFSKALLEILRTPQDIIEPASKYMFVLLAGIFATVFYNLCSNIIRALGDSKTPLYFLIFSAFANIFLDILFVIKLNGGIVGAAVATVLAQAISTIFCLIFMYYRFPILRIKRDDFKVSFDFLYEHLRIGIPMGIQMSVLTIGIIAVQYVLNGLGSKVIAAYTTAVRVDQLVSQTLLALGMTMATYTAQNFGANKMSRIKEGAKAGVFIAFVISVICFILLFFFGEKIVAMFMSSPDFEIISLAQEYLNIVIIFFFFLGLLFIYRNILQGMGNAVVPLLSGVAELVMRVVAAFVLGHYMGYRGICLAGPCAWVAAAIILYLGYKISLVKKLKKS